MSKQILRVRIETAFVLLNWQRQVSGTGPLCFIIGILEVMESLAAVGWTILLLTAGPTASPLHPTQLVSTGTMLLGQMATWELSI